MRFDDNQEEGMEIFLRSFMLLGFTLVACTVVVLNVGWLIPVTNESKGVRVCTVLYVLIVFAATLEISSQSRARVCVYNLPQIEQICMYTF